MLSSALPPCANYRRKKKKHDCHQIRPYGVTIVRRKNQNRNHIKYTVTRIGAPNDAKLIQLQLIYTAPSLATLITDISLSDTRMSVPTAISSSHTTMHPIANNKRQHTYGTLLAQLAFNNLVAYLAQRVQSRPCEPRSIKPARWTFHEFHIQCPRSPSRTESTQNNCTMIVHSTAW